MVTFPCLLLVIESKMEDTCLGLQDQFNSSLNGCPWNGVREWKGSGHVYQWCRMLPFVFSDVFFFSQIFSHKGTLIK